MSDATLEALAADAYVYGSPMVRDLTRVDAFVRRGLGSGLPATPFNRFAHARELATARTEFASVNNDTLYSIAQLDLSGGPVLLHVPDSRGDYYVLQFVDAWTNNFAYLGRRSTGTAAQTWLITPPHWHGTPSEDVQVIVSPTTVATIVGRHACDGPSDLPRVLDLQRQLTLTPLEAGGVYASLPEPDPDVREDLRFLEQLRVWMAAFPPAEADVAYQQRFAPLGLLDAGTSPYLAPAPEWATALAKGLEAGRERVEAATRPTEDHPAGEWSANLHLFDYNLDYFGPGTVASRDWRTADRRAAYLTRAAAARIGLWGNHAYEAAYAITYDDAEGKPLTGARSYTLRLDHLPPVDAFWSITVYDVPDYRLVENPIGRYSIGDRTQGLSYGEDGSLTLVLQHRRPDNPAEVANWLPTPAGEFRPILRMYQPRAAVLDGSYRLPPIEPR
ncbi:DUF1254 domain-containing protein [Kitasatospora sp. GP82]|uniref:DUF1254 domain-containing protein n=1 Tax=Kitasatospora sp. GP82 TaxID=3035089 RepID=UPI002474330D|nr:DUF1254 domain-containing protein [Kitasatospora sp. GP82]MDH6124467.1 hypothetical protein [Kitasatospora sp. GP82]